MYCLIISLVFLHLLVVIVAGGGIGVGICLNLVVRLESKRYQKINNNMHTTKTKTNNLLTAAIVYLLYI